MATDEEWNETVRFGWFRSLVGLIGEQIIYGLIRVFGRRTGFDEMPWLAGPFGGESIGDEPYRDCALREGLTLLRNATSGGLVPDFDRLGSDHVEIERVDPRVRAFYEQTARHRMDVWAQTHFPANIALWLLVTTISRRVDQLNFPVRALDTAMGMTSEIVLLQEPDGRIRYTGWFRKIARTDRVLYTGFYSVVHVPECPTPCVKVVFPMPNGNATVILRPGVDDEGAFLLTSDGGGFGDAGFYRVQEFSNRLAVWRIASLRERFRVFVDPEGTVRCDHSVRFLGLPVLKLHYRIEERRIEERRTEERRTE